MSILSNCEITCSCTETFEAEIWKAVNVFDDPDLKELILSGRFNTVQCPKCKKLFYHEHFFIYQDLKNEFIAYVYPKHNQNMAAQFRKKMLEEFKEASQGIDGFDKIDFLPVLYFGIEDLIETIKNEDYIKDEIDVLSFIAKRIELDLIRIKPSAARNLCIVHTIPKNKKTSGDIKKDIVSGLETLLQYNPNLSEYEKLLARIKNSASCLDEILLHKKTEK